MSKISNEEIDNSKICEDGGDLIVEKGLLKCLIAV